MKTIIIALILLVSGAAWAEECKYTVSEIDALRSVVEYRYLWGTNPLPAREGIYSSRFYNEVDMSKVVEERVRTYMKGCIKAEDIIKEDKEAPK